MFLNTVAPHRHSPAWFILLLIALHPMHRSAAQETCSITFNAVQTDDPITWPDMPYPEWQAAGVPVTFSIAYSPTAGAGGDNLPATLTVGSITGPTVGDILISPILEGVPGIVAG
jgi:hypothetical protein